MSYYKYNTPLISPFNSTRHTFSSYIEIDIRPGEVLNGVIRHIHCVYYTFWSLLRILRNDFIRKQDEVKMKLDILYVAFVFTL